MHTKLRNYIHQNKPIYPPPQIQISGTPGTTLATRPPPPPPSPSQSFPQPQSLDVQNQLFFLGISRKPAQSSTRSTYLNCTGRKGIPPGGHSPRIEIAAGLLAKSNLKKLNRRNDERTHVWRATLPYRLVWKTTGVYCLPDKKKQRSRCRMNHKPSPTLLSTSKGSKVSPPAPHSSTKLNDRHYGWT